MRSKISTFALFLSALSLISRSSIMSVMAARLKSGSKKEAQKQAEPALSSTPLEAPPPPPNDDEEGPEWDARTQEPAQGIRLTISHLLSEFETQAGFEQAENVFVGANGKKLVTEKFVFAEDADIAQVIDVVNARTRLKVKNQLHMDTTFGTGLGDPMPFHFFDTVVATGSTDSQSGRTRAKQWNSENGKSTRLSDVADESQAWFAFAGEAKNGEGEVLRSQFDMSVFATGQGGGAPRFKVFVDNTDRVNTIKRAICILSRGEIKVESLPLLLKAKSAEAKTGLPSAMQLREIENFNPGFGGSPPSEMIMNTFGKMKTGDLNMANFTPSMDGIELRHDTLQDHLRAEEMGHVIPALSLAVPCQLKSVFDDVIRLRAQDQVSSSEMARLARMLWKNQEAAEMIGHIWKTIDMIDNQPGDNLADKLHNLLYYVLGLDIEREALAWLDKRDEIF